MLKKIKVERLEVLIAENRDILGKAAADLVANRIKKLLLSKPVVNIIFAAAPSQNEFLTALIDINGIEWQKINAFHMDEYLGLPDGDSALFSSFLKRSIFNRVPFASVNLLKGDNLQAEEECTRYAELLRKNPVDIVCMGIGENSHIAFNDPHVADFNDPLLVKIVTLDLACRQQQVGDGCFSNLKEVPQFAITLTVPALMNAKYLYCMVPGLNKAKAVAHTLNDPISEVYPSTILKKHPNAILFADRDSYSQVEQG